MFGPSRKKKPTSKQTAILSFTADDEDASSDERPKERRRKRTKKLQSSTLSFDPEEGDIDTGSSRKKRKHSKRASHHVNKNKSGMGYGGMTMMDEGDEMLSDGEDKKNAEESSLYDKAALEKLKTEQKRRERDLSRANDTDVQSSTVRNRVKDNAEEEFISLSGASDPVVLAGDDAMAYIHEDEAPREFDHGLEKPPKSSTKIPSMGVDNVLDEDDGEGEASRQWEDNMARRAGVLPPISATSHDNTSKVTQLTSSSAAPLSQIKSSLQPTISNLQNVSLDLETSLNRHEATLSSTRDELSKHQSTLEEHGGALEYYQMLRAELADWTGALRQIQTMVDAIVESRMNWEGDVTLTRFQRGYEQNVDSRMVLKRERLLDHVIGGDDESGEEDEVGGVDEFGRDLSSIATYARKKRWEIRRRNALRKKDSNKESEQILTFVEVMNCMNSDNISHEEIHDWQQRNQALNNAASIISSMVNDEYLSITNLCNLFFRWQDTYPSDYKSTYAEMSLVGLISVLVKLELCQQQWDGLGLVQSLENEQNDAFADNIEVIQYRWFEELKGAMKTRSNRTQDDAKLIEEVTDKCILPVLLSYLNAESAVTEVNSKPKRYHGLYDPTSISETKFLCRSIRTLFHVLSSSKNTEFWESTIAKVITALLSLLKHQLDKKSTLMIQTDNLVMYSDGFKLKDGHEFNAETTDAIFYALHLQANQLSSAAINVLSHWYPVINSVTKSGDESEPIIRFILNEIISSRILPIHHMLQRMHLEIHSVDQKTTFSIVQQSVLSKIFHSVKGAGLLEKEEWVLQTAPLRAALKNDRE